MGIEININKLNAGIKAELNAKQTANTQQTAASKAKQETKQTESPKQTQTSSAAADTKVYASGLNFLSNALTGKAEIKETLDDLGRVIERKTYNGSTGTTIVEKFEYTSASDTTGRIKSRVTTNCSGETAAEKYKYKEDGSYTKTTTDSARKGVKITDDYNKDGKLTQTKVVDGNVTTIAKYNVTTGQVEKETRTEKHEDGSKTQKTSDYTVNPAKVTEKNIGKNGKVTKTTVTQGDTKTEENKASGMQTIFDNQSSTVTSRAKDGSAAVKDRNGNLSGVSTKIGDKDYSVNISYDDSGKPSSVKIGDKTYTNISVNKNGAVTVKDDSGKPVFVTKKSSDGKTQNIFYENGKKAAMLELNSDGEPESTKTYNEKGKVESRRFANSQKTRTYEYDDSGKLLKSTDTNKNGVKTSSQTYSVVNGKSQWSSRTTYNSKGEETGHTKYEYSAVDENGNYSRNANKYKNSSSDELVSKSTTTYDKYKNPLKKVQDGKTTVYNYDQNPPSARINKNHLTSAVTTDSNGNVYTNKYQDGTIVDRIKEYLTE